MVTITIKKSNWQLSISVSQKTSELLTPLVELYGGHVYIDNGSSQSFKWYITRKEDILKLIEYFKQHPSRSVGGPSPFFWRKGRGVPVCF